MLKYPGGHTATHLTHFNAKEANEQNQADTEAAFFFSNEFH